MQLVAAIGVACGAVIGVMTVTEKITGLGTRWLARGVVAGTRSLREDVNDVKDEQRELKHYVRYHLHYVRYHLGPNDTTTPVHQRLRDVEAEVRALRRERGQG